METIMQKTKKIKSYTLSDETVRSVEAYASYTGNSLSQSAEYLILRGLENTQIAEKLTDRITQQINRFIENDNKNTDRLIAVLLGQTRSIGKVFGVSVTSAVRTGAIDQNELQTIYGSGIKQCMQDLRSGGKDHV
jgi:hypothetical protein